MEKRRRGRKSINLEKASSKNITLYARHYNLIDKNGIELSSFSRWLLNEKKDKYKGMGFPDTSSKDVNSSPTSVSLYKEDLENAIGIDNFSNFIRWGLETEEVLNEFIKK